ncbi:MAG: HAD family hydrolase [Nanoarchaeota archaeon]
MSLLIGIIIAVTAFLALYWVFYGQRKYNEMLMPNKKHELKAILFDMDGVILDSFEASCKIFNELRRKCKLSAMSREDYRKSVWGGFFADNVKKYLKTNDAAVIEIYHKKLILRYKNEVRLMPGAEKVLKAIKEKNIKIGLVTNTLRGQTEDKLRHYGINNYFDAIVTGSDVERVKPYPDPVLKLCSRLEAMPEEAILVGDTKFDYKAGKAAGCMVVGLNADGDLVISKLDELLQLL